MRRRRRLRVDELKTPRLTLRPTTAALGPALVEAKNRSLPELRRWMAWADEDPSSTLDFAAAAENAWLRGAARNFTLVHDGEVAGNIGLEQMNVLIHSAMLGYWLRSDLTGRGLMTEAATAVVRHAFQDAGLHRLELHVALENHASIRIAEKLGFRRRGILRDGTYAAGAWMDVYVYDLLATDPHVS
ncbi:MAG: GNAT family N-acetyltransferase [Actinomycetota bacterium]